MRSIAAALTAVVALAMAGCGTRGQGDLPLPERFTRIEWLGNQGYLLTTSLGTRILTNPYVAGTGGRTLPRDIKADILLVTTERPEANNINALANQPAILRGGTGIGINSVTGIKVRGVPVYKNPDVFNVDGMNLVFGWSMDGMRFCFAGHLDRPPTADEYSRIGPVDVLFVSTSSMSRKEIEEMVERLAPGWVVPMGGRGGLALPGGTRAAPAGGMLVSKPGLPLQPTLLVFSR